MPDLTHLWQRFLLASALFAGLVIGAAGTVFGYSNLGTVNIHWSVFHIDGVPLWTVAVVPLAVFVVAGTLYHWYDGLHHFTEHMRHRRRVHELEAEVASLRAHLDQILEMPDHSTSKLPAKRTTTASLPTADEGITQEGTAHAVDIKPVNLKAAPVVASSAEPSPNPADGVAGSNTLIGRKGRGRPPKRATLSVAGKSDPAERSGSDVEGGAGGGHSAGRTLPPVPGA